MKKTRLFMILTLMCMLLTACHDSEPDTQSESVIEEEQQEETTQMTQVMKPEVAYSGKLNVFSISGESYIRSSDKTGDLSSLGSDEYFSYCLRMEYNGAGAFSWNSASVSVDDGEQWYWGAGSLNSGSSMLLHIYNANMQKCMTEGIHTVRWFFDEQEVYQDQFVITKNMDWASVFPFPSKQEISAHNSQSSHRSPYLAGWLTIPSKTRYTEYTIDFKADHLPKGTYCSLGNWTMDYSPLLRQYESVRTESSSIHAYAGFQNLHNDDKVAILSFWDVYCTDALGKVTTIRAKRVYPEVSDGNDDFGGEGTGAHSLVSYEWEADHWYRMHLKCTTSKTTGNTVVEQWACDLETGVYTLSSAYDTGVAGSAFQGSTAIFLENFLNEYSGEVRSMQVRNAQYLEESTGQWKKITEAYVFSDSGLPNYEGSYNFGSDENGIWMITSGVGGDWYNNGKGKQGATYAVK